MAMPNLIKDPGFEDYGLNEDNCPWVQDSGKAEIVGDQSRIGSKSLYVNVYPSEVSTTIHQDIYPTLKYARMDKWRLSAWAKSIQRGSSGTVQIYCIFYYIDGTNSGNQCILDFAPGNEKAQGWTYDEADYSTNAKVINYIRVYVTHTSTSTRIGEAWIDDLVLSPRQMFFDNFMNEKSGGSYPPSQWDEVDDIVRVAAIGNGTMTMLGGTAEARLDPTLYPESFEWRDYILSGTMQFVTGDNEATFTFRCNSAGTIYYRWHINSSTDQYKLVDQDGDVISWTALPTAITYGVGYPFEIHVYGNTSSFYFNSELIATSTKITKTYRGSVRVGRVQVTSNTMYWNWVAVEPYTPAFQYDTATITRTGTNLLASAPKVDVTGNPIVEIVDQANISENIETQFGTTATGNYQRLGQTFTAQSSRLRGLTIMPGADFGTPTTDIRIDVTPVDGSNQPYTNWKLARTIIPYEIWDRLEAQPDAAIYVNLGVELTPGTMYAIVLSNTTENDSHYRKVRTQNPGPYDDGILWRYDNGTWYNTTYDMYFKLHYDRESDVVLENQTSWKRLEASRVVPGTTITIEPTGHGRYLYDSRLYTEAIGDCDPLWWSIIDTSGYPYYYGYSPRKPWVGTNKDVWYTVGWSDNTTIGSTASYVSEFRLPAGWKFGKIDLNVGGYISSNEVASGRFKVYYSVDNYTWTLLLSVNGSGSNQDFRSEANGKVLEIDDIDSNVVYIKVELNSAADTESEVHAGWVRYTGLKFDALIRCPSLGLNSVPMLIGTSNDLVPQTDGWSAQLEHIDISKQQQKAVYLGEHPDVPEVMCVDTKFDINRRMLASRQTILDRDDYIVIRGFEARQISVDGVLAAQTFLKDKDKYGDWASSKKPVYVMTGRHVIKCVVDLFQPQHQSGRIEDVKFRARLREVTSTRDDDE